MSSIKDMHRFGKWASGKWRGVIRWLFDFNEKMKLKKTRNKWRALSCAYRAIFCLEFGICGSNWSTVKNGRTSDNKVYRTYGKIVINQETHVWDESRNQRRRLVIADTDDDRGETRNGTINPSGSARHQTGSHTMGAGVAYTWRVPRTHEDLRLLSYNAQSIVNRVTQFDALLFDLDPHVTLLIETRWHAQVIDKCCTLS